MAPRLLVDRDAVGVVTVTLNRPEVGNAYDGAMIAQLQDVIDELRATPCRALVLRGSGRHFQTGADLEWMSAVREGSASDNLQASLSASRMFRELNRLSCLVVAVVQGACLGGGTGLVACSDIVIAAEDAVFSIAEVRWGLQPGIIVPQLNDAMSPRQVRRYALTGERFSAAEARRTGLVHEIVEPASLDERLHRVLDELLHNGPSAVRETKRQVLESSWSDIDDPGQEQLAAAHAASRASDEAAEGMRAFAERRAPGWAPQSTNTSSERKTGS